MKVFKFGGASVKDPSGIRNLSKIVSAEKGDLVIVVSAFGKTTNALEKVLNTWIKRDNSWKDHLERIYNYHNSIVDELFDMNDPVWNIIENSFAILKEYLLREMKLVYDYEYDQIVSYGEIWSTLIISEYLNRKGLNVKRIDIRDKLVTDDRYRDANILWGESYLRIRPAFDLSEYPYYLTQGFIGAPFQGRLQHLVARVLIILLLFWQLYLMLKVSLSGKMYPDCSMLILNGCLMVRNLSRYHTEKL